MNTIVNYMVEANIGLLFLLASYSVLLARETDFTFKRWYLMIGILASLIFPFFHINVVTQSTIGSIREVLPVYWLPEVTIREENQTVKSLSMTKVVQWLYSIGLFFFALKFIVQLSFLLKIIIKSRHYRLNGLKLATLSGDQPTFSFFNYVFIGQADSLSETEKSKIIQHESVHARQYHSLDILLLSILGIFFWFNPFIRVYKKIFVQLHEFEADARSVGNHETNEYCNLLARVALQSSGLKLANHFNHSLTIKRIAMIKTIKQKISRWKLTTALMIIPALFFIIACQDQVMDEVSKVAQSSAMAQDIPVSIQKQIDSFKALDPNKQFVVVETSTEEGKATLEKLKVNGISHLYVLKDTEGGSGRSFVVIKMDEQGQELQQATMDGDVFLVVEESAEPVGGMSAFYEYVSKNIAYTERAKNEGVEGKVFVQFIVEKDGRITEPMLLKGIGSGLDEVAFDLVKNAAPWIPGKQKGEPVRQKMVLPIVFKL
ncbi:MAG: TonB family protein [Cyclobacteriaceae bacterium]|nr:TonB family protein [Cyclobacteriaceae bacterium]